MDPVPFIHRRLDRPDSLVQWEAPPHVYLFPKPLDWTEEITVAGHVTLRDDHGSPNLPHALTEFAFSKSSPPAVHFGVSAQNLAVGEFEDLVRKVDQAAQHLHVRVIIQARELRDAAAFAPHRSRSVYMTDTEIRSTRTTSPALPFTSATETRPARVSFLTVRNA
ncbi:hypothetical protein PR003_g30722 [Phytophthora rubi]|uniref:Uncharacterized protein n=1 Tax=Phytophthora rubi TaxID=129364 RepID=A0A6A4BC84_9STRA|nr:hypothetical protein PR003_g30722 [Phytophthora rubi]